MISLAHELFMSEHYPVTLTEVQITDSFLSLSYTSDLHHHVAMTIAQYTIKKKDIQ